MYSMTGEEHMLEQSSRRSPSVLRAGQSGKMLVPLLGVLALLAVGVSVYAIYSMQQERDKRIARERDLKIAQAENEDLKSKVNELQEAKATIESDLSRARKELAQAQQDLAKAVEKQESLAHSIEDREREIGRLTKDLEQSKTQQKQATDQLTELQNDRDTIKKQMADLERAKSELESKMAELSQRPTVELDKVVVSGDKSASATGVASTPVSATTGSVSGGGQVVVVNREYDFIVMNMGKNQGLSIGQEFKIVRGNEVLGKVKVEKVYDELSAAAILPESKKESIKEGDSVVAL